jgi:hypothetical protein
LRRRFACPMGALLGEERIFSKPRPSRGINYPVHGFFL